MTNKFRKIVDWEEYIKNYIQFTHELEACVGNLHHDRAKIS